MNPFDLLKLAPFVPVLVKLIKAVQAAGKDGKFTPEEVIRLVAVGLAEFGAELVKVLPPKSAAIVREFLDLIPELADVVLLLGTAKARQALAALRAR